MNEEIEKAVFRRAIGYDAQEITEEYSGENELLKRKVSIKHYPPDMTAVKVYSELSSDDFPDVTSLDDAQLKQLKLRLISQLNDITKGEKNENSHSDKQD